MGEASPEAQLPTDVPLLEVGPETRRRAAVDAAWAVLRSCSDVADADAAAAAAGEGEEAGEAGGARVVVPPPPLPSQTAQDTEERVAALQAASGGVARPWSLLCSVDQGSHKLFPLPPAPSGVACAGGRRAAARRPRRESERAAALARAADALARLSGAARRRAVRSSAALATVLERQRDEGKLLTRPAPEAAAVQQQQPLERLEGWAALRGGALDEARLRKTEELTWKTLLRLLPTMPNVVLTRCGAASFEVGLMPWNPGYWVLRGEAPVAAGAEGDEGPRFSLNSGTLPEAWLRHHLVGAVCESFAETAPFGMWSATHRLTEAVVFLQHVGSVFLFADVCRAVGLSAKTVPLRYPDATRVLLMNAPSGDGTREQRVRLHATFDGHSVTVADASPGSGSSGGLLPSPVCTGVAEATTQPFAASLAARVKAAYGDVV